MAEKFFITTAIPYTSKRPHIGNTYEVVLVDAIARYQRLKGKDVFFLTGTDEHGQKIEDYAKAEGITPKEYVDTISSSIKSNWDLMGASYDKFIRTTDEEHKTAVQKIFKKMYEKGDIYKSVYEGMYCKACESFFTSSQLTDGKCPDCGKDVETAKEEAYFFRLSKYQDRLIKHIEDNPDFIQPESRKREMLNNFLKPGLRDLCVSRTSFKWGIPVTFDEAHVVYVWIDALSNYITALGYDPYADEQSAMYKKNWPADLQVIGKDILRFHTIYWPCILMSLGEPLPKRIIGHPWLLFDNEKMSKSVGNVMYAEDLVKYFGVDSVRYYLLSNMPFAQDGSITYKTLIAQINTDLANTLGNLVNRTVAMQNKYFDGILCTPSGEKEVVDDDLFAVCTDCVKKYIDCMDRYHLADAVHELQDLARRCNKYIDETMPWSLAKDEQKKVRLGTVLYNLLECIRHLGIMLLPIVPESAVKILDQIGAKQLSRSFESLSDLNGLVVGDKVGTATPLFERIDEAKKMEEIEKLAEEGKQEKKTKKSVKSDKLPEGIVQIGIEDFAKVSLCCAEIVECEPVAKSDKLLLLTVNDGSGERSVVSGIAQWYSPSVLVGKKIILVSNLKPAKLRGVMSNGMILAADVGNDARVIFLDSDIPNGAKVR